MQSRRTSVIGVLALLLMAAGIAILWMAPRDNDSNPTPTELSPGAVAEATATLESATPIPMPSPSPLPLFYTVRDGDTLASIAASHSVSMDELAVANSLSNPNLIYPGQILIIPGAFAPTPDTPPTPTPPLPTQPPMPVLPTPTLSGSPLIEIAGVLGAGDLQAESIRVRNRGGIAVLEGWTIADTQGDSFVFPRVVLYSGSEVTVHSRSGQSTPTDLYWNRSQPAWDSGALIVLTDDWDAVVDTYIAP